MRACDRVSLSLAASFNKLCAGLTATVQSTSVGKLKCAATSMTHPMVKMPAYVRIADKRATLVLFLAQPRSEGGHRQSFFCFPEVSRLKAASSPPKGYVEHLERRVLSLERLLRSLGSSVETVPQEPQEQDTMPEEPPTATKGRSDRLPTVPFSATSSSFVTRPAATEAVISRISAHQSELEAWMEVHDSSVSPDEDHIW